MSGTVDRRAFLRRSAGAAAAIGACATRCGKGLAASSTAASSQIKSQPDVIISRGGYPGWPWVASAGKDRLVCVFRDDSQHGFSPTGKALWTESRDGGHTWSAARVLADDPGVDDRNVAIAVLPDGTWMACYNTYTKELVSRCMVTCSRDGGATWQKPIPMSDRDARTRAAAVVLSSGDILIPIYLAPGSGAIAARSGDGGKSWSLARIPDTQGFLGDEWTVLEVEKGRLVGILRNSGANDGFFWKTESRDGGRTWDRPVKTNVQSQRYPSPAQLDFQGKTPVLTYSDRREVSVSMATCGDPGFVTWDVEHRRTCYQYRPDGQAIADGSYPVSVAVGPHRRLIVDYEIRSEGKWISGYFVDLPEAWQ